MKKKICVKVVALPFIWALIITLSSPVLWAAETKPGSKTTLPKTTLKYSSITSPGSSTERYSVKPFAEWIDRESSGMLKLEYYPSGVMAQPTEITDAVMSGLLDIANGLGSYSSKIPEGALEGGLPFLPLSLKELFELYTDHSLVDLLRQTYGKFNIYYVNSAPAMEYRLFTKSPVTTLSDLKGKKIRATGFLAKAFQAVGAVPVSIAGPEMYMAAQRGVVDGIAYPLWALESYKFKEVTNYILMDNLGPLVVNFIVNMKVWNTLPKEYQQIIHRASVHAALLGIVGINAEDEVGLIRAEQYGLKTTKLTDSARAEWMKIAGGLWDDYAKEKGPQAIKELSIINDYLRAKGKVK